MATLENVEKALRKLFEAIEGISTSVTDPRDAERAIQLLKRGAAEAKRLLDQ